MTAWPSTVAADNVAIVDGASDQRTGAGTDARAERLRAAGRNDTHAEGSCRDPRPRTELDGFGASASDYGFEMEHCATGAGVRVTGDRPMSRLIFWAAHRTACPEPYIDASVEPGRTTSWTITYRFYRAEP